MKRIPHYWFPVVAWLLVIALFSGDTFHGDPGGLVGWLVRAVLLSFFPDLNPQTIALVHGGLRKLAHMSEYCVLVLLLYRALRQDSRQLRHWRWALWSFLVGLSVAGLDEFHQSFTSRRSGSIWDVGFDAVGMFVAQIMLWRLHRRH